MGKVNVCLSSVVANGKYVFCSVKIVFDSKIFYYFIYEYMSGYQKKRFNFNKRAKNINVT